ncbi:MAG: L-rhamnose/proton symporter RhaT [Planctomycetota bacterium]
MTGIPPNPMAGVALHSVGALLSANCYAPQKYLRQWSWEVFWMTQAFWCWFMLPIIGALVTIPELGAVLSEAPREPMIYSFLMGLAYGVGGTSFNISIRYIGFSLTYAIAVGLSAVLGSLVPPLVRGELAEILARTGSGWVIAGVAVGALGIAVCGFAGRLKEVDLRQAGETGQFSLIKGLALSFVAGLLSAVYGFALEVAQPVIDVAAAHGAGHWKGNVAYLFANTGAFVTATAYSLYLSLRNRTLGELTYLPGRGGARRLAANHLLSLMTGTLWYGQFFFYNLGHVRMGQYAFTSWAIHMIMLVLFSNLLAVVFREWKGTRPTTRAAIAAGLLVLVASVLLLTYGNYLGGSADASSSGG